MNPNDSPEVPAYTAEDLLTDPRLPVTEFTLPPARDLAAQGWTPADVSALLDDFPAVTKKHRQLLNEALSMAHAMPDKGLLAGQVMPPVVVRGWLRLLRHIVIPTPRGLAFQGTAFAEEFRTRPNGSKVLATEMVKQWGRTTGNAYLAMVAGTSGLSRAEYVQRRDSDEPLDVDTLVVLGALRYGITLDPEVVERAKAALG